MAGYYSGVVWNKLLFSKMLPKGSTGPVNPSAAVPDLSNVALEGAQVIEVIEESAMIADKSSQALQLALEKTQQARNIANLAQAESLAAEAAHMGNAALLSQKASQAAVALAEAQEGLEVAKIVAENVQQVERVTRRLRSVPLPDAAQLGSASGLSQSSSVLGSNALKAAEQTYAASAARLSQALAKVEASQLAGVAKVTMTGAGVAVTTADHLASSSQKPEQLIPGNKDMHQIVTIDNIFEMASQEMSFDVDFSSSSSSSPMQYQYESVLQTMPPYTSRDTEAENLSDGFSSEDDSIDMNAWRFGSNS